jgi:endoglucanase
MKSPRHLRLIGLALLGLWLASGPLRAATSTNNPVFVPENPPAMQPLPGRNAANDRAARWFRRGKYPARIPTRRDPAYRAAQWFQHGVNLGDYLEAWPRQSRSIQVGAEEFAQMRHEGFDHVRVPVGWHHYAGPGPDFTLSPTIFSMVDFAVTNSLGNHLAVMINMHHFDELDADPAGHTEEFLALWRQIAAHYAAYSERLAFELDNEPHENATTALMNPIYARAIAVIRKSNPHRTIFVEPGGWGSIGELKNLVLPPDDNVIVSVHCYDPFYFTHQGATWTSGQTPVTGIRFPGPPATPLIPDPHLKLQPYQLDWIKRYNTLPTLENPSSPLAFENKLRYVRAWSDYYGRPVHLGEFGAFTRADSDSRARFYAAFRWQAEKLGLGWAIWDWSANFRYWDKKAGRPMPGMAEALFGKLP